jgi:hypothetical protein
MSTGRAPLTGSAAARSMPNSVRSEFVVCCWTLRLSDCAPDSVNPFCVTLLPCSRANGAMVALAGA